MYKGKRNELRAALSLLAYIQSNSLFRLNKTDLCLKNQIDLTPYVLPENALIFHNTMEKIIELQKKVLYTKIMKQNIFQLKKKILIDRHIFQKKILEKNAVDLVSKNKTLNDLNFILSNFQNNFIINLEHSLSGEKLVVICKEKQAKEIYKNYADMGVQVEFLQK